ncbi:MAG TPA: hypothetical protein VNF68_00735, partial [Candidatus Baltobacteraceae bacterium]|nr:hypothetical protein [Candidatus Baltobacteraceae bacterium]
MNRPYLLALTLALIGASAAPAPLVVGTIRDQHGAPIMGARVRLLESRRVVGTAKSGPDGTFSAFVVADRIHVNCDYCRSVEVPVSSDGTAIAIVTRYDAIASEVPTDDDLAHLPYARVESDIALTPFVVLNQSSRSIPGASLSDRNAYPQSGLIVINGVPDYDIVAAVTPFDSVAYRDATSVSVSRTDDAHTYDDLANAGTFGISTSAGSSLAYGGSDTGARVRGGNTIDASAAWSNWNQGDRRAQL